VNAVEIHLRAEDGWSAKIAGNRRQNRCAIDPLRIEPFERLLHTRDEFEIRRRRGGRGGRSRCDRLRLSLLLLEAERLQLTPLLVEALLLARGLVIRPTPRTAEGRGDVVSRVLHLCGDDGCLLLNDLLAATGDNRQGHDDKRSFHAEFDSKDVAVRAANLPVANLQSLISNLYE